MSYCLVVQLRIKELEDAVEQERELRIRVSAEPNITNVHRFITSKQCGRRVWPTWYAPARL